MYKYFFGLLLFIVTIGKSQDERSVKGLSGAYQMLSQSLRGSAVDTTFTERKQLKIYTDRYMMYVRLSLADSVSSFGIGTFSIKKGKLTEHIIYSALDATENTNSFSGTVNISIRHKGYEQVIPEIVSERGKVRLTEDYELLGTALQSPLDGTWKETAAYAINKKDTIRSNAVKYRTYYRGNFCTGSFITNASVKKQTVVEYGTFEMKEINRLKENITYSNMSARKDKSYNVNILMKGNDAFIATFINDSGIQEVEKYMRMK